MRPIESIFDFYGKAALTPVWWSEALDCVRDETGLPNIRSWLKCPQESVAYVFQNSTA